MKHIWCLDTDWKMQKGQLTIIICKIIRTSRDCPMFAFGATSLSDRKDIWLARSVLRVLSSAVTHSKVWDTALLASLLHYKNTDMYPSVSLPPDLKPITHSFNQVNERVPVCKDELTAQFVFSDNIYVSCLSWSRKNFFYIKRWNDDIFAFLY